MNPSKGGKTAEAGGRPARAGRTGAHEPALFHESKGSCDGIVTSLAVARLRPTRAHGERHRFPADGAAVS